MRRKSKGLGKKPVNGIWHAVGTVAGHRIRKSLGTRDEGQAEELRSLYEARLWKRHNYGEEAVRVFEEAVESYLEQGGEGRFLTPLIRHFRGRALATIKPADVKEAAIRLYPKAGPATRNRQGIVPAIAVVNHGHQRGWCGAMRVQLFPVPKSRKHKPVDRIWLGAFMAEADRSKLPHLSAIVLFMHQTGARVSEAVRLEAEHVDLGKRVAVLVKTKTEDWSVRDLTAALVARIAGLGARGRERVFGYTDPKAVNRVMKRVAKRAGIVPRTTHSAGRHSFGTNAMSVPDANIKEAMDAGGWKSVKQFMETYVHTQEAGKKLAAKFDAQAGPIDINKAMSLPRRRGSARKVRGN
jgi:integrase